MQDLEDSSKILANIIKKLQDLGDSLWYKKIRTKL